MKKFKRSTPLIGLVKVKTFSDIVILFSHQYGYSYKYLAEEVLKITSSDFSNKLNTGKFTAHETITISNFIREKV